MTDILETARWTGSAKNTQPWRLIVVRDRGTLKELSTCGQFAGHVAGATCAVVLVMDDRRNALDAGRLAENIMLAAWAHGVASCIGSVWPGEDEERAKKLLGVPPERAVGVALSLGYPADTKALRVSQDNPANIIPLGRMELKELVSWDKFGQH